MALWRLPPRLKHSSLKHFRSGMYLARTGRAYFCLGLSGLTEGVYGRTDMSSSSLVCRVLLSGALCAAAVAQADTLQKIADSNTITVSYRESAVPFSYVVNGSTIMGFSVDLSHAVVDAVRQRLGRPDLMVKYLPVNAQNRIPLLMAGNYDLECGSTTNNVARGKDVAFSINFFYAGTRVLVRKGDGIGSYADLAGKQVTSVAGSTNLKVMQQYSDAHQLGMQWQPAKDYADAFGLLAEGKVSAVALDDILLYGLRANAANPEQFTVVGDTLQVEPYACMLRKGDPAFKSLVDGAIAGLMRSGRFARLYALWFQSPIPPRQAVLAMPMSPALQENLRVLSDQPAR